MRASSTLLLLCAAALCSGTARADPARHDAWYVDLGIGIVLAADQDLNDAGAEAEFDMGRPIGSAALVYEPNAVWRLEAELAYRRNDLETLYWPDDATVVTFNHHDEVETLSLMLNGLRRFRIGAFQPYLGAGIGAAEMRWRMGAVAGSADEIPILRDDTVTLALQLIGGFDLLLSPRWGAGFDYRLWHAPDFSLEGAGGEDYDLAHTTHSFQVHLRYLFAGAWHGASAVEMTPDHGWTVSGSVGLGYAADSEVTGRVENLDAFRTGPVFTASVGRVLSPRWRLALTLQRRENDVEVVDFNPETGQFPASGTVTATSLSAGIAYRFRPHRAVRPYVAVGLGAADLDYQVETRGNVYLDDSDTTFIVTLAAGLDIALNEHLAVSAGLESWYADPVQLEQPDGSSYETWHLVHSMNLGLSYSF